MRPGGAATEGTVDIANTGTLSGGFVLTRNAPADSDSANPLSGKLNVVVDDCGVFSGSTAPACGDGDDVNEYTGTLAGLNSVDLGDYTGGAKHRYRFRVALDSSAGNEYQGDSSSVTFHWTAA
jgi:hypothetical protein